MNDPLESGSWFNKSNRALRVTAIVVAVGFALFCIATAYFVAQYFVCIGNCAPGTPPLALMATSIFFGLIPAVGTGGIGYFIVRGLWEDARQVAAEERAAAPAAADPSGQGKTARQPTG